jgi:hypothetical protein
MTLEEILVMWDRDSEIPSTNLGSSVLEESRLHSRYMRFYTAETQALNDLECAAGIVMKDHYEMYMNGPSNRQEAQKWYHTLPSKGALNRKGEFEIYLGASPAWLAIKDKVDKAKLKVDTLRDILRQIHKRSYIIQQAIADAKFKAGIG